jgi:hypothetical protein
MQLTAKAQGPRSAQRIKIQSGFLNLTLLPKAGGFASDNRIQDGTLMERAENYWIFDK